MSKTSRWRIYNRRFLVDPFQLRLVGVAAFHFVLVIVIFAIALFAPIVIRLESGGISSPHVQTAAREFLVLHTRLWAPLFGAFVLLVLHNILVTHRVAGPLFRFRRYLKSVGDGDFSNPFRIRRDDYLQKEAQVANDMVESLRGKVERLEKGLSQTNGAWEELRGALADRTADDLKRKIDAVGNSLDGCRASVTVFKTETNHPRPAKTATEPSVETVAAEA